MWRTLRLSGSKYDYKYDGTNYGNSGHDWPGLIFFFKLNQVSVYNGLANENNLIKIDSASNFRTL